MNKQTFILKGIVFQGDHEKILQDYLWSEETKRNEEKEHLKFIQASKEKYNVVSYVKRDDQKLYANTTLTFFEYCKENVKIIK